uniref:G_PROTEIN_RECEP_F1_2 domain-containing protein n=1 Tax=Steinernema glaseri TaxID=37863 RepID=A0A1I7YMA4_9BILA
MDSIFCYGLRKDNVCKQITCARMLGAVNRDHFSSSALRDNRLTRLLELPGKRAYVPEMNNNTAPFEELECFHSNETTFRPIQGLFRVYLMPMTYLFGICANAINILVFSHPKMRNQLVNWFFFVLSISDLSVLVSSFFVFSMPVIAEYSENYEMVTESPRLLVWFYPIAHTSHTTSVYLTILVSVHRYLGVCHPFLVRRISSAKSVKIVLSAAVIFAVVFNIPRWFELQNAGCLSEYFQRMSEVVLPTKFMLDPTYTIAYRNVAFIVVMFLVPFITLTIVNCRIISTLRSSNKLRRSMTYTKTKGLQLSIPRRKRFDKRSGSDASTNGIRSGEMIVSQHGNAERKEHGVTVMLVAIVTEFLIFNALAFANNILELYSEQSVASDYYTALVETSTLMVNLNGATTIVIYLAFGSKYRSIFVKMFSRLYRRIRRERPLCHANETSVLVVTSQVELQGSTCMFRGSSAQRKYL